MGIAVKNLLRKAASLFLKMSAAKISTNLTRMAVAKNPHAKLASIYSKNLRVLAKMPTDYAYRKFTENTISERAALVKNESNVAELKKENKRWSNRRSNYSSRK